MRLSSIADVRWKNESALIVDGNRAFFDRKYFFLKVCSGFIAVKAVLHPRIQVFGLSLLTGKAT